MKLTPDSACIQCPLLVQGSVLFCVVESGKEHGLCKCWHSLRCSCVTVHSKKYWTQQHCSESVKPTSWFEVGVQLIMEQPPHIRTFWDTNCHLRKGDRYVQVSQRESNKGNFEVQHSTGEIGGLRGKPVYKKYKSSQDAKKEFDRLCSEALQHGCAWEHNELTHGRIVIDFTNWPSIALW